MADILHSGAVLKTVTEREIQVLEKLGNEGAFSSWRVTVEGEEWVLRWYRTAGRELWDKLCLMAEAGTPGDSFLWPADVTEYDEEGFGGLYAKLPEDSVRFWDQLQGKNAVAYTRRKIDAALNLVRAFHRLHESGFCYGTHDGDFYILANSGKVLLDGAERILVPGRPESFAGDPRYTSPEVLREEAKPGVENDRYVLGVWLFQLFCGDHPLCGKKSLEPLLTRQLELRLFGTEPLFVFEDQDRSNGPVPGIHSGMVHNWKALPEYMKQLFRGIFGQQGLTDPASRPDEMSWLRGLLRFRGSLLNCSCGMEWYAGQTRTQVCEKCGKVYTIPLRIVLGEDSRPALKGARIFRGQLEGCTVEETMMSVAQVMEKNDAPGVLGLQNRSGQEWTVSDGQGEPFPLAPGKVMLMKAGLVIRLGENEIRIEAAED